MAIAANSVQVSPAAAGLFCGEEAGDHCSPSFPATVEASFPGCWDDNSDDITPMGSVLLAADDVEASLSEEHPEFKFCKHYCPSGEMCLGHKAAILERQKEDTS